MTTRPVSTEHLAEETLAEVTARDHNVKIVLLATSLAVLVLLAAAAFKENVLTQWRRTQLEYRKILRAKATDDWGRSVAADFKVKMRQVVVPELGAVDRCVSCHNGVDDPRMTDVPQPHRVHPGKYLQWHDPQQFGCTICHRGQGRAMSFPDVKAVGHHWDYPLLPKALTQSSCGVCHTADEVAKAGGDRFAAGRKLYDDAGCAGCHKLGGRGGALGPELDREGMKVTGQLILANLQGERTLPQWLLEHFDDPQRMVAGSQMRPSQLSEDENLALTTYMLSLQGRDLPSKYLSPGKHLELYRKGVPEPRSGAQLFALFCSTCHDSGTYGRYDKFFTRFMPAVRGRTYSRIASKEYLTETIRKGHPGSIMAAWTKQAGGLTDPEIGLVADYLLRPVPGAVPSSGVAPEGELRAHDASYRVAGNAGTGASIFVKQCVGCHGLQGEGVLGPSLNNPVFQAAATDGFVYATIAYGRRDTAMPSFLGAKEGGWSESAVRDLVAFVRSLGSLGSGAGVSGSGAGVSGSGTGVPAGAVPARRSERNGK